MPSLRYWSHYVLQIDPRWRTCGSQNSGQHGRLARRSQTVPPHLATRWEGLMSKKKAMSTTAKRKHVAAGCKAAASDSKGGHWTQSIEPKSAALLSKMLGPTCFVVKNLGSNNLLLASVHGAPMDL